MFSPPPYICDVDFFVVVVTDGQTNEQADSSSRISSLESWIVYDQSVLINLAVVWTEACS